MSVYFVSRHSGAHDWLRALMKEGLVPYQNVEHLKHFDLGLVREGDVVLGTLPMALAAGIVSRRARFVNLDLELPPHLRGVDLTASEMRQCKATLTEYSVVRERALRVPPRPTAEAGSAPDVTVMLVSSELAPQLIGVRHLPTQRAVLIVTPRMAAVGERLKELVGRHLGQRNVSTISADHETRRAWDAWAAPFLEKLADGGRCKVRVNCTGGTKLMSMALGASAARCASNGLPVSAHYVNSEVGLLDPMSAEPEIQLQSQLNLEELLACQGLRVTGAYSSSSAYTRHMERHNTIDRLLELPGRLIGEFNSIVEAWSRADGPPRTFSPSISADLLLRMQRGLTSALEMDDCLVGALPEMPHGASILTLKSKDPATRLLDLKFMGGGWLECWVARQIQKVEVDEFAVGVNITDPQGIDNELDAAVVCGNQLLVMEVKTMNLQRQDTDMRPPGARGKQSKVGQQTIYKSWSVGNRVARLFAERWLVSLRPLAEVDRRRAEGFGVKVFIVGSDDGRQAFAKALNDWRARVQLTTSRGFKPSQLSAPRDHVHPPAPSNGPRGEQARHGKPKSRHWGKPKGKPSERPKPRDQERQRGDRQQPQRPDRATAATLRVSEGGAGQANVERHRRQQELLLSLKKSGT